MPSLSPSAAAPIGLELTLRLLAKTRNEAAVNVLIPALDCPDGRVQLGALAAILERLTPAGHREIVRRLHQHADAWRPVIDARRGRLIPALRDAVLGADEQACRNACNAVLWFHEFDLIGALLTAAEDAHHFQRELAAETLLQLGVLLYEDLARSGNAFGRRDPALVRKYFVNALEQSVLRYARHQRREPLQALLMLSNRDSSLVKQILLDQRHAAHDAVMQELLHSEHGGMLRLLLGYLEDPHAPPAALVAIARRSDDRFVSHLLRKVGYEPSPAAAANLRKIDQFGWLKVDAAGRLDFQHFDKLDDAGQHSAVRLLYASGMKRADAFRVLEHVLITGKPGGRRAASQLLAHFSGAEANRLALAALEDQDPRVQANIVPQLRRRGLPGALVKLIQLIDNPHEVVRSAARESLAEFDFDRYLAVFDSLDEEVRRSTGVLVKKICGNALSSLAQEFENGSRMRRLRAVAMATSMDAVAEMEERLTQIALHDEDHMARSAAVHALGQCRTETAAATLRECEHDRSVVVQEAAERSLLRLQPALQEEPA